MVELQRLDISDKEIDSILVLLHNELYSPQDLQRFIFKSKQLLQNNLDTFLAFNLDRAANIYVLKNNGAIIGVGDFKFYKWSIISKQLYLDVKRDDSVFTAVRLQRLSEIISSSNSDVDAIKYGIEAADFWIHPEFRGKGLSKILFNQQLDVIKQKLNGNNLWFTIAQGAYIGSVYPQLAFNLLLEREEQVNGTDKDDRVNVRGVWVDWSSFENLGMKQNMFVARLDSQPTIGLAKSWGMENLCYTRYLSPVYCTIK